MLTPKRGDSYFFRVSIKHIPVFQWETGRSPIFVSFRKRRLRFSNYVFGVLKKLYGATDRQQFSLNNEQRLSTMPSKGGRRKKTRTHVVAPPTGAFGAPDSELTEKVPKTFVLRKGKVHANVSELVEEMRRVMEPNTARKLRERSKNTIKDYVSVSGVLGVTHLLVFSQTDRSLSFRVCRTPAGPTMTFKVQKFSLTKHVRALQKRPQHVNHVYNMAPLVVLNNFGGTEAPSHVKLMKVTLQNMFPSINVATVKLQECRRVVMFNLDKASNNVEMRHYAIRATPTGITKAIKKVVQAKVPDLHALDDISEYVAGVMGGGASDSEVEDEESKVMLSEDYIGRGNVKSQKCSIRLQEIGPRMTLQLMKVERGLSEGEVLYHSYVTKTQEEIKVQRAKMEERESLKRRRRTEQEENVSRKKQAAEEAAAQKASRRRERADRAAAQGDADESEGTSRDGNSGDEHDPEGRGIDFNRQNIEDEMSSDSDSNGDIAAICS